MGKSIGSFTNANGGHNFEEMGAWPPPAAVSDFRAFG
jgi:hypothetical protein